MISKRRCTLIVCGSLLPAVTLLGAESELIRRWEFKSPADAEGWRLGHDLADLKVENDALRLVVTGADAYLFAPPVEAPLDGCMVRIRMGADHAGSSEVFWITADAPEYSPARTVSRATSVSPEPSDGSGETFETFEFVLGRPADQGRKLTGFRIDPYNGPAAGHVRIAWVELRRLPPQLDLHLSAAQAHVDTGKGAALMLRARPLSDGRAADQPLNVTWAGGSPTEMAMTKAGGTAVSQVAPERAGVVRCRAAVADRAGSSRWDLETSLVAGSGEGLPITATMQTDQVRVEFVAAADGQGVGAARWSVAGEAGRWIQAGWLLPLADVAYAGDDGRIVRRQPALTITKKLSDAVRLEGKLDDAGRLRTTILLTIRSAARPHQIAVTTVLEATGPSQLLDFSGPVLRAEGHTPGDPLNRYALFGGLEFLEPGWRSSSDRAVGPRFAERWSPSPYKITLPVMAIEAGGLTTAMMWLPTPAESTNDVRPWATFASPNFLDGQDNHLMKLSVPCSTDLRRENELNASRPLVFNQPGTYGPWQCILHAERNLPLALVARRWYEAFRLPPPPLAPHDDETTYNLIARNFGETTWWAEERGWRRHWYHSEKSSSYEPEMAAELIVHSILTEDARWVNQTGLKGKSVIDARGSLAGRLAAGDAARAHMATMRPDGTWAFENTKEMRDFTRWVSNGEFDSLGEDGTTSLGTCVQPALALLRHAEIAADAACLQAGVKALAAMRRFRVPRGAQVWEVHQEIPDIRGAALAVEAYHLGYRLTGDRSYLEDANYWAWTGVPFAYSWPAPTDRMPGRMIASRDKADLQRGPLPLGEGFENSRRQIMPYATVPVLGPTCYVINWFGVIVQWCGLEWAQHVIELDADRPDPLLRKIADGVVASGLQQMFDKPPWTGLYPDVWDVRANIAQGAFIWSGLPLRCLQAQGRVPVFTRSWTQVLRSEEGRTRWHVSGWGTPPTLPEPHRTTWSAKLDWLPGQPGEMLLAGAAEPRRVQMGEDELTRLSLEGAADRPGWCYWPEKRSLLVRFNTPPTGHVEVRLEW